MRRPAYTGLTAEEARELFSYDRETGDVAWKTKRPNCHRVVVGESLKGVRANGYIDVRVNGKLILVHRLAWLLHHGRWPVNEIDHIDGCKTNNAIVNLREATSRQNKFNRACKGYFFRGNYPSKNKYHAKIRIGGKPKHIGCFATPEEAQAAYVAASKEYHGEFSPGRTL